MVGLIAADNFFYENGFFCCIGRCHLLYIHSAEPKWWNW